MSDSENSPETLSSTEYPSSPQKSNVSQEPTKSDNPIKATKSNQTIPTLSSFEIIGGEDTSPRYTEEEFSRISKKEFRRIVGRSLLVLIVGAILVCTGGIMVLARTGMLGGILIAIGSIVAWKAHPIHLIGTFGKRIGDTNFPPLVKHLLFWSHVATYVVVLIACFDIEENKVLLIGCGLYILLTLAIAWFKDGDLEKNSWGEPPPY